VNGRRDPLHWLCNTPPSAKVVTIFPGRGSRSVGIVRLRSKDNGVHFCLFSICTALSDWCRNANRRPILSHCFSVPWRHPQITCSTLQTATHRNWREISKLNRSRNDQMVWWRTGGDRTRNAQWPFFCSASLETDYDTSMRTMLHYRA
jgi:hypothetical protein